MNSNDLGSPHSSTAFNKGKFQEMLDKDGYVLPNINSGNERNHQQLSYNLNFDALRMGNPMEEIEDFSNSYRYTYESIIKRNKRNLKHQVSGDKRGGVPSMIFSPKNQASYFST